jgi:hypothetical protein
VFVLIVSDLLPFLRSDRHAKKWECLALTGQVQKANNLLIFILKTSINKPYKQKQKKIQSKALVALGKEFFIEEDLAPVVFSINSNSIKIVK